MLNVRALSVWSVLFFQAWPGSRCTKKKCFVNFSYYILILLLIMNDRAMGFCVAEWIEESCKLTKQWQQAAASCLEGMGKWSRAIFMSRQNNCFFASSGQYRSTSPSSSLYLSRASAQLIILCFSNVELDHSWVIWIMQQSAKNEELHCAAVESTTTTWYRLGNLIHRVSTTDCRCDWHSFSLSFNGHMKSEKRAWRCIRN